MIQEECNRLSDNATGDKTSDTNDDTSNGMGKYEEWLDDDGNKNNENNEDTLMMEEKMITKSQ